MNSCHGAFIVILSGGEESLIIGIPIRAREKAEMFPDLRIKLRLGRRAAQHDI